MKQDHSDWLPFCALTNPAIISVFEQAIYAWSKRWFGDRPFELAHSQPRSGMPSLNSVKTEWRAFGHGIFIDWSEKTQIALAEQGLHAPATKQKLSDDDKSLLLAFSERIVDDFSTALFDVVGHEANQDSIAELIFPYENGGGLELKIHSLSDEVTVMVGISSAALARLRKKQCNRYIPEKTHAASIIDILGPAVVAYSAEIGSTNISAFDLRNMVEGDVVVLDRPVAAALDILVESSRALLFKASLGQHEGRLALTAQGFEGNEA